MTTPWRIMFTCLILYFPLMLLLCGLLVWEIGGSFPLRWKRRLVPLLVFLLVANTAAFIGAGIYNLWTFTE